MDELRVALLRNWQDKGFAYPVYGVLDAEELAISGEATLAMGNEQWCMVAAHEVIVLAGVDVRVAGADIIDG